MGLAQEYISIRKLTSRKLTSGALGSSQCRRQLRLNLECLSCRVPGHRATLPLCGVFHASSRMGDLGGQPRRVAGGCRWLLVVTLGNKPLRIPDCHSKWGPTRTILSLNLSKSRAPEVMPRPEQRSSGNPCQPMAGACQRDFLSQESPQCRSNLGVGPS